MAGFGHYGYGIGEERKSREGRERSGRAVRSSVSACPASDQGEACLIGDVNGVDTVELTHRQRTGVRYAATCQR